MKLPSKETLDLVKGLTSLAQKAILAVGVLILVCYCLSEQIMPDGLSLGDAMTLIMIALGFGVVMVVGIAYGMIAALAPTKLMLVIINAIKKGNRAAFAPFWQGKFMTITSMVCLLLIGLFVLVGMHAGTASDMKLGQTILCYFTIGMLLLCIFAVKQEDRKPLSFAWSLGLGALAIVTPVLTLHPAAMNITMTALGIRSAPGSLIVLDSADYPKIEELVTHSGLSVHFCQLPKSEKWGTTDARVVWRGVGAMTFVSFLDRPSAGRYAISTSVPKANLQVVRPEHLKFDCDNTLAGKVVTL